ncbi:MAG TPA: hypothetical protein PLL69_02575 [Gemmatimonadales bacterium]|nr:hypothetical protein [Gemmatimonadales bacterium]
MSANSAQLVITPERLAIPQDDVVFAVEGPGTISCLQGIFTNDLEKPGPRSLLWGAMLTQKGMIVSDGWIRRDGDSAVVVVPRPGAAEVADLFRRSLPPRLARVTDLSGSRVVWWLTGDVIQGVDGVHAVSEGIAAPFRAMAVLERDVAASGFGGAAGITIADSTDGDILALFAGWPVLGREIDDRTLIQEVRFDELGGVRYDKGCYVGQETVARLHFRGHPNRTLRALAGTGAPPAPGTVVGGPEREMGRLATVLSVGDRWLASCRLRREVETGAEVAVGPAAAVVGEFPIDPASLS